CGHHHQPYPRLARCLQQRLEQLCGWKTNRYGIKTKWIVHRFHSRTINAREVICLKPSGFAVALNTFAVAPAIAYRRERGNQSAVWWRATEFIGGLYCLYWSSESMLMPACGLRAWAIWPSPMYTATW